jgi:YnbE-like lipoprotein
LIATGTPKMTLAKEGGMRILVCSGLLLMLMACTPTVEVKAPEEPITINLNVKIEHEIRVKVDRELDDLFDEDSELF